MSEGLRPRPEVPADVLAAIRLAAERAIEEGRATSAADPPWRFSGRWYSAHPVRSRRRPGR